MAQATCASPLPFKRRGLRQAQALSGQAALIAPRSLSSDYYIHQATRHVHYLAHCMTGDEALNPLACQRERTEHAMSADGGFWPEAASVGEVVYPPGSTFGPRIQLNLQLVMLHSGHVTVWIDGEPRNAAANSVFVLFPGHEEFFAFAEECETWHTWLHIFSSQMHEDVLIRLNRLEWPLQLSPTMNQLIRDALVVQATPFSTAAQQLKALAIQMLWRYIGEGELHMVQSTALTHVAVEQAQQFIHAHLSEPITLDSIAQAVAVSPAHLIRLFQAQIHTTPVAYLWQRRVAKGIELLEQTGLTVGTIAARCGFQSRYHFSRRVREAVGYTPLDVRRRSWQHE